MGKGLNPQVLCWGSFILCYVILSGFRYGGDPNILRVMQINNKNRRGGRKNSKTNSRPDFDYKRNGEISNNQTSIDRMAIFNEVGRFCADRTFVKLRWTDQTIIRPFPSGSNSLNWAIRSSAYDPDPALGTGAIPGFVEMANLYLSYRVHAMTVNLLHVNQDIQGVILGVFPSNVGYNVNSLNQADILEYTSNVHSKSVVTGGVNGQNRSSLRVRASGKSLVGPDYATNLEYTGSTSGNPSSVYWLNFAATSMNNPFAFNQTFRNSIVYEVEFFERRQLES